MRLKIDIDENNPLENDYGKHINQRRAINKIMSLNAQVEQLEAQNKKYLGCLKMILRRDCCWPICDGGDCDCVWERVCQTIDQERWKEIQAMKGGE